jgi:hypothetical protein
MMSTTNSDRATSISNEAYELLDRFVGGLDDIIYELAEDKAKQKNRDSSTMEARIKIDVEDVKFAAQIVIDALKEQLGADIPHLSSIMEDIESCYQKKARR